MIYQKLSMPKNDWKIWGGHRELLLRTEKTQGVPHGGSLRYGLEIYGAYVYNIKSLEVIELYSIW